MQIYYGHQEFQVGDYGNEQYMRAALDCGAVRAATCTTSAVTWRRSIARKIDQYISRMLTDRNSKRTMAEFATFRQLSWRDHLRTRRARAFTLGLG